MPSTEQLAKELEQHYKIWWAKSYPNVKPSPQAVSTAAAFALDVLRHIKVSFTPAEKP